jgi:Fe-S-cluster containining protein
MPEPAVTPSEPVPTPDQAPYVQRLDTILAAVSETTSVRDLDAQIDQAVAAIEEALPPFRCRQGCYECCEDTIPVVTAAEWRLLHAAIAQQPETFQQELHQRTAAAYRSQVDALGVLAARLRGEPAYIEGVDEIGLVACPLLQDGKCSVYEARPAMCRAFGYMTVVDTSGITPIMCPPAIQHIRETCAEDPLLPRWEPFQARLNHLTRKQGIAHLPLWIMAQHELGGYLVPAIDDPMPWTVKRMSHSALVTEPPSPLPDPSNTSVGRPPVDQGLGLSLGKPAVRPRHLGFGSGTVAGTMANDLPFTD